MYRMSWFAHLFSIDSILQHFCKLHSSVEGALNMYTEYFKATQDCRERCVKLSVASGLDYLPSGVEIQPMRTVLIDGEEVREDRIQNHSLGLPRCLFEQCMRGTLFTCTESAMSNFIGQGVSRRDYKTFVDSPSAELIQRIVRINLRSKALYTRFLLVCNQAMRTRKKNAREAYFDELGYTTVSGSRRSSVPTKEGGINVKKIWYFYQPLA